MLSKGDKTFIKTAIEEIVRVEIRKALTIRVKMEKNRDDKTGQPLAVPFTEEKDVYIPEFWITYLPYYEGAIRGMQETVDTVKNNTVKNVEAVRAMTGIMLGLEGAVTKIAEKALLIPEADRGKLLPHQIIVAPLIDLTP